VSESKLPPVNLYGILDNELTRMHQLMALLIQQPTEQHNDIGNHYSHSSYSNNNMSAAFGRIVELQHILTQALIAHDKLLQEKIAELALTGVPNDQA